MVQKARYKNSHMEEGEVKVTRLYGQTKENEAFILSTVEYEKNDLDKLKSFLKAKGVEIK